MKKLTILISLLLAACSSDESAEEPTQAESLVAPTGGAVQSLDGKAALTVPAGALTTDTTITVAVASDAPTIEAVVSNVYDFGPDGLTFESPVTLCIDATVADLGEACLGYLDESANPPAWTCEDITLEANGDALCGETDHFTLFAILLGMNTSKDQPPEPIEALLEVDAGGKLKSADGAATLSVPAGALGEKTHVSLKPGEAPDTGATLASGVYRIEPADSKLKNPATLCIKASVDESDDACLGFIDESEDPPLWRCEDKALDLADDRWCGDVGRFGSFAVVIGLNNTKKDPIAADVGGTVVSDDGRARLAVPAGALAMDTLITVVPGAVDSTAELGSPVYDFGPDGLEFQAPATLMVRPNEGVEPEKTSLAFFDEAKGKWECLASDVFDDDGTLWTRAEVTHFTSFAILLQSGDGKPDPCKDEDSGVFVGEYPLKPKEPSSFVLDGGNLEFHVESGAVLEDTMITVYKEPSDPEASSPVYDLKPDGITFQKPLTLCIRPNEGFEIPKGDSLCLAFRNAANEWECEDKCLKADDNLYCGKTDHFTSFALLLTGGGEDDKCQDSGAGPWTVGPDGAEISAAGGEVTLSIPPGALQVDTDITIATGPAGVSSSAPQSNFAFGPEGQEFLKPVTICMLFKGDVGKDSAACLAVQNAAQEWECVDKCLSQKENLLCGETDHFSNYGLLTIEADPDACPPG